jgi:NusA-like KH domain protein
MVKKVQNQLDKDVKIFEYSENLGAFVNNIVPVDIRSLDIENEDEKKVEINVSNDNKGRLVGREGENIEAIREILARTHSVDEVKVK